MKLYFKRSSVSEDYIASPQNLEESYNLIQKDIEERVKRTHSNFKSYYTRTWMEQDDNTKEWIIWFDVGSYTEFYICKLDEEEIILYKERYGIKE